MIQQRLEKIMLKILSRFFKVKIRFIFFTFAFFIFLAGCQSEPETTLRLAHNNWPGYQPLTLAKVSGLIDAELEIYHFPNTTEILKTFQHDLIDIAAVTLDEAISLLNESDDDIVIFLVIDVSNGGDAIIAQPAIKSIADLKGKRLGVESSALGAYILSRALDLDKTISFTDIEIFPLTLDKHMDSFITNQVDAIVTFEPIKSNILTQSDGHVIFDSRIISGEIVDVLICKEKTLNTHKATLKKLVSAYFEALDYIAAEADVANQKMADYSHTEKNVFINSKKGLLVPDKKQNLVLLSDPEKGIRSAINKLKKFMLKQNLIEKSRNNIIVTSQVLSEYD